MTKEQGDEQKARKSAAPIGARLHRRPEIKYRQLDADRAKVLYAVLKLRHNAFQQGIATASGFSIYKVGRYLNELVRLGYLIIGQVSERDARNVYEVDPATNITSRDTAVILLELLNHQMDSEGKVRIENFVEQLILSKKLSYLTRQDLLGEGGQKGKIDELIDEGKHIERVSSQFIRPRMKIGLEKLYLHLVAQEIPVADIRNYQFQLAAGAT